MIKDLLQSVEGITIYPIISLIVFVLFFVLVIIWMFKADKNYIKKMENLPLDKDEETNFNNTGDFYEKKV
jgi:cytochrome c oxidase cbb3-type subunit 4